MHQISKETKTSVKKYVMDGLGCREMSKIVDISYAKVSRIAKYWEYQGIVFNLSSLI